MTPVEVICPVDGNGRPYMSRQQMEQVLYGPGGRAERLERERREQR